MVSALKAGEVAEPETVAWINERLRELTQAAPAELKCSICSKKFKTEKGYLAHKNAKDHYLPTEHGCNKCKLIFSSSNGLELHILTKHKSMQSKGLKKSAAFQKY